MHITLPPFSSHMLYRVIFYNYHYPSNLSSVLTALHPITSIVFGYYIRLCLSIWHGPKTKQIIIFSVNIYVIRLIFKTPPPEKKEYKNALPPP